VEGEMVVEYWDGVAPAGRGIRDISESGAYICTTEKWYSGAIIRLVFRGREAKTSVPVLAQVVRQGQDGFAMEFMFNTVRQREEFRKFLAALPAAAKTLPQPPPPERVEGTLQIDKSGIGRNSENHVDSRGLSPAQLTSRDAPPASSSS
jgi:hypothetical protein